MKTKSQRLVGWEGSILGLQMGLGMITSSPKNVGLGNTDVTRLTQRLKIPR
jgi:hypothetical protein